MSSGVTNQRVADFERRVQPLVRIEDYGIRTLEFYDALRTFQRYRYQDADTSIDVQPEILFDSKISQRYQVFNCTGIDRSSSCDYSGQAEVGLPDPQRSQGGEIDS